MPFVDTNSHLTTKPHNLTSNVKASLKAMTDTVILGSSIGVFRFFFFYAGRFFPIRERSLGVTAWTLVIPERSGGDGFKEANF